MKNSVIATPYFVTRFKRFRKKFPSLSQEISELESALIANPTLGTNLGANLYKIRLASKSKGSGKSGGFRIVTFLLKKSENGYEIFLLTIYDKSQESTISKDALLLLVKDLF